MACRARAGASERARLRLALVLRGRPVHHHELGPGLFADGRTGVREGHYMSSPTTNAERRRRGSARVDDAGVGSGRRVAQETESGSSRGASSRTLRCSRLSGGRAQ
jgi:hypothetical protein